MHNVGISDLNGEHLRVFVTIYEAQSVSKAAQILGVSQSTLSHRLERLRTIVGDPLFVRAGRGITPTTRADHIVLEAKSALASLSAIVESETVDPTEIEGTFVIAATDFERALFLLDVQRQVTDIAPRVKLKFAWERVDNSELLRQSSFDIAVSPSVSGSESDIKTKALFKDKLVCFYDANVSGPVNSLSDYLERRHLSIMFSEGDESFVDRALSAIGKSRDIAVTYPSLTEAPAVMAGADLIATVPSRLRTNIMRDFSYSVVPFPLDEITYSIQWHARTDKSPIHQWLREQIITGAKKIR